MNIKVNSKVNYNLLPMKHHVTNNIFPNSYDNCPIELDLIPLQYDLILTNYICNDPISKNLHKGMKTQRSNKNRKLLHHLDNKFVETEKTKDLGLQVANDENSKVRVAQEFGERNRRGLSPFPPLPLSSLGGPLAHPVRQTVTVQHPQKS
ncbi:hypothetical protein MG293_000416 [Ovis ammon polii]|uniref:Uncharacterized protein n=1 Tax=Ovis ammon polii TaxID=230172 RepID=A0AAD4UMU2_OVIAM|nr:hypothetical protein MG293_000416 [Ovis ammon polii]